LALLRETPDLVRKLLLKGADPNKKDPGEHGQHPLVSALVSKSFGPDVIEALLRAGARPQACDDWVHEKLRSLGLTH
jgi:hypothetical protein